MPNLIRHLLGYMPVNIVLGLSSFGGVFLFTRLMGADDYGRYALAFSAMHVIHTLTLTWTEAAGYRFYAEAQAKGHLPDHFKTCLALALISLVPAFLVLGATLLLLQGMPELRDAIVWILILLPVSVIVNIALQSHKAGLRVARFSAIEIGRTLGGFLIGAGLAWIGGFGAAAPLIGIAVSFSIAAATEGYWLWRQSTGGHVDWHGAKKYLAYGIPISAALVLDLILSASDRFLIAYFIDEAAVGAYAAGYGVADKTVLMICAWAAMAGAPLVMEAYEMRGKQAAETEARGMAQAIMLLAIPAAVGIAVVAKPLSDVMIGEELRDQAREIIPWIAVAGLFNGLLIHYFSEAFQLAHKTAERAFIMLIPSLLNIGLNIVLLPVMGLMGAVYATVFCYVLAVALLAGFGRRHLAMPVPMLDLAKILGACLAMAGAVQLFPGFGGLIELMCKAAIGALTYGLCVVSLNAAGARGTAISVAGKVKSRLRTRAT